MLVGGVALDHGSNYRLGNGPDFVFEGDEYDTAFFDKGPKFLHYVLRVPSLWKRLISITLIFIAISITSRPRSARWPLRWIRQIAGRRSPPIFPMLWTLHRKDQRPPPDLWAQKRRRSREPYDHRRGGCPFAIDYGTARVARYLRFPIGGRYQRRQRARRMAATQGIRPNRPRACARPGKLISWRETPSGNCR